MVANSGTVQFRDATGSLNSMQGANPCPHIEYGLVERPWPTEWRGYPSLKVFAGAKTKPLLKGLK